jgi:hypothetical protein
VANTFASRGYSKVGRFRWADGRSRSFWPNHAVETRVAQIRPDGAAADAMGLASTPLTSRTAFCSAFTTGASGGRFDSLLWTISNRP